MASTQRRWVGSASPLSGTFASASTSRRHPITASSAALVANAAARWLSSTTSPYEGFSEEPQVLACADGSGRHISYEQYGAPKGAPIFFMHDLPGSRVQAWRLGRAAKRHGVRVLAIDRPGFGFTTPLRGERSLMATADDVITVADTLDLDKFGVVGWGSGAPFALACARAVPDRVRFLHLHGAAGPPRDMPSSVVDQLGSADRNAARLLRFTRFATRWPFALAGFWARRRSGHYIAAMRQQQSIADQEVLANEQLLAMLARDLTETFRQGSSGPADDAALALGAWGFPVEPPAGVPVTMWHGSSDSLIPYGVSTWLAAQLKAELHLLPTRGHYYLYDEAFADKYMRGIAAAGGAARTKKARRGPR